MHYLLFITMLASVCFAHYRGGYESRHLFERDDAGVPGVLVECPVCENVDGLVPINEKCNIMKGGKRYKRCERGTYINEVCGNKPDCYRGPDEMCSEKMAFDDYGLKCARGFYCNDVFHVCTGPGSTIDSNALWILNNVYRYRFPTRHDVASTKSESGMILA